MRERVNGAFRETYPNSAWMSSPRLAASENRSSPRIDVSLIVELDDELALFGKNHKLKAPVGNPNLERQAGGDSKSRRSGEKDASPCATRY